jgi:SAM-dependent methyltransferase
MNKKEDFDWSAFWENKAQLPNDFQATGRGGMDILGFLYTLCEIASLLDLKKTDTVLDIGCGTGIIALALSPWVKLVHGIDISSKMIDRATKNCAYVSNVAFSIGSITHVGEDVGIFDKVCAYSVLQYLKGEEEVLRAFKEISRVLRPGGIAFLAANPDPERKNKYIGTIERSNIPQREKERNLELIEATLWISRSRMLLLTELAGVKASIAKINPNIWQHFYMYNLVIRNG